MIIKVSIVFETEELLICENKTFQAKELAVEQANVLITNNYRINKMWFEVFTKQSRRQNNIFSAINNEQNQLEY